LIIHLPLKKNPNPSHSATALHQKTTSHVANPPIVDESVVAVVFGLIVEACRLQPKESTITFQTDGNMTRTMRMNNPSMKWTHTTPKLYGFEQLYPFLHTSSPTELDKRIEPSH
jgi:hypothetical protein